MLRRHTDKTVTRCDIWRQ